MGRKFYPKANIKIWLEDKSKTPLTIKSTLRVAFLRLTRYCQENKHLSEKEIKKILKRYE